MHDGVAERAHDAVHDAPRAPDLGGRPPLQEPFLHDDRDEDQHGPTPLDADGAGAGAAAETAADAPRLRLEAELPLCEALDAATERRDVRVCAALVDKLLDPSLQRDRSAPRSSCPVHRPCA